MTAATTGAIWPATPPADAICWTQRSAAADGQRQFADVRLIEAEELRLYAQLGAGPRRAARAQPRHRACGCWSTAIWGFAVAARCATAGDAAAAARLALRNAVARRGRGQRSAVDLPPGRPSQRPVPDRRSQIDPFAVVRRRPRATAGGRRWPTAGAAGRGGVGAGRGQRQAAAPALRQHRGLAPAPALRSRPAAWLVAMPSADGDGAAAQLPELLPRQHRRRRAGSSSHGLDLVDKAARVGEEAVAAAHRPDRAGRPRTTWSSARSRSRCRSTSRPGTPSSSTGSSATRRNFAGTSFIRSDDVGSLRYGSPAVNDHLRPDVPGTRGSFAFDDEGTPARAHRADRPRASCATRCPPATRPPAAGRESTGAARVRRLGLPAGVLLHPRLSSSRAAARLDELLDRLGDGYYLDDNRSWSIDNRRLQLPVRHRGRLRGARRPPRPAAAQLLLRRDHPAVLGLASRRLPGRRSSGSSATRAARANPSSGASSATARRRCWSATSGPGWPE